MISRNIHSTQSPDHLINGQKSSEASTDLADPLVALGSAADSYQGDDFLMGEGLLAEADNVYANEPTLTTTEVPADIPGVSQSVAAVSRPHDHLVSGPLLRGLGMAAPGEDMVAMQQLSEEMGSALQAAIRGLLSLHQQVDNSRYGVMNRNLQPIEDNPLRLGLDYQATVDTLFNHNQRSTVHLSPQSAIAESLLTVRHHNEAVQAATKAALQQILQAFSPAVLMRRFLAYRRAGQPLPESGDAWAWQMYQSYYRELTSDRQQGFEKLFWEIFDQAYDRTLRGCQAESAQPNGQQDV